ncbi:hypothetical protein K7472_23655 [Streptomyces sp. PTM05]|uniref:DMSO/TMAO reductase YedYZ heme-binding membrane subunit n=1 Tax=Streptantibioticus parmotrematis TaxID=2873249 RepID=A0ABS7QX88_9ACTN|nr:hypothetical protein [Streptantibioticus parmotrematis]MBY8887814.1 hypothetical protein [Streptantibioticus parmotrematis]
MARLLGSPGTPGASGPAAASASRTRAGVLLTVTTAVVVVLALVPTMGPGPRRFLDYGAGVFTLVSLTSTVVYGLMCTGTSLLGPRHRIATQALHRATAVAAFGFLILHVSVKVGEAHVSLVAALVPFSGGRERFLIGLGVVAGYLLVLSVATGVLRGAFAGRGHAGRWRMLHACAYPAWFTGLLHGLKAGRSAAGWVNVSYILCVIGVCVALVVRWRMHVRDGGAMDRPAVCRTADAGRSAVPSRLGAPGRGLAAVRHRAGAGARRAAGGVRRRGRAHGGRTGGGAGLSGGAGITGAGLGGAGLSGGGLSGGAGLGGSGLGGSGLGGSGLGGSAGIPGARTPVDDLAAPGSGYGAHGPESVPGTGLTEVPAPGIGAIPHQAPTAASAYAGDPHVPASAYVPDPYASHQAPHGTRHAYGLDEPQAFGHTAEPQEAPDARAAHAHGDPWSAGPRPGEPWGAPTGGGPRSGEPWGDATHAPSAAAPASDPLPHSEGHR